MQEHRTAEYDELRGALLRIPLGPLQLATLNILLRLSADHTESLRTFTQPQSAFPVFSI